MTSESTASEEASEEAATDAAKRAGDISHDNKDGLFVLGEVAEDMPADETAQDLAEVVGKIQSDGTEVITDESSAGEKDPGAGAETEAAFVPAPDGPAAPASTPVETAAAGVQVGAEIVLVCFAVDGVVLSPYLQEYLYGQLSRYECEWFFPVALCQIYQESRYQVHAVNPNGLDKGLCQFREQYWEYHAKLSGLYEYDIWNPIDQLWVYAWLMSENLRKSGGDVGMALSRYYLGEAKYSEAYVQAVMQWTATIKEAGR